jgi:hypothetical protein
VVEAGVVDVSVKDGAGGNADASNGDGGGGAGGAAGSAGAAVDSGATDSDATDSDATDSDAADSGAVSWTCSITPSGCLCSATAMPGAISECAPSNCCFLFGQGSPQPCACNTTPSNVTCDQLHQFLNGGTDVPKCPP